MLGFSQHLCCFKLQGGNPKLKRYDKFNFVFFLNAAADYYKYMLYDIFALNNVRVIDYTYGGTSFNFKPYRPATNPLAFRNSKSFVASSPQAFVQSVARDFPTNDPIVFFFWMNDYYFFRSLNFFNYLRDNYPNCKLVCWLTNPIHYYQGFQMFHNANSTKEILSTFDCIMTHIMIDAINYGLTCFEKIYSVLPYAQPKLSSDVFFVGRPKERLEKILRAYESFKAAGLICDFYIADVHNTPPWYLLMICISTSILLTIKFWSTSCVQEPFWILRNAEPTV